MQHRFAFFYWRKWAIEREGKRPPSLVSIDYHRDLAHPNEEEIKTLSSVQELGPRELGRFCWEVLHPNNDGHVLAAAHLNLISDILVLRSGEFGEPTESPYVDKYGNQHRVIEFTTIADLEAALNGRTDESAILDIDLDYFIDESGLMGQPQTWSSKSDDDIEHVIDSGRELFRWLRPRISGITLALEPSHCGGLRNCARFFQIVEGRLFDEQGHLTI